MKNLIIILSLLTLFSLNAEDLRLDIMFSNDVHGGISRDEATFMNPEFPPKLGGGASHATLIKYVRSLASDERANLLLDAGDFWQGKPIGTVTNGEAVIEYYNMIGYDALTIGNHEYDIKGKEIVETLKMANFPILSCNIVDKETGKLVDYVQPYVIVKKMGVNIGIIGVTTIDTKLMSFPENIKGIDFLDEIESLNKYIPIVKDAGADIIIVLGHMGLPYDPAASYEKRFVNDSMEQKKRYYGWDSQEILHFVPGIDLLVGGHMHKGFAEPWIDPVTQGMAIQGYAFGSNLGWITLKIDKETKTLSGYELPSLSNGLMITKIEDEFPLDPEINEVIEANRKLAEKGMDDVIGVAETHLHRQNVEAQSPMGNTVADAMRLQTNADFSFLNLGGIRAEIGAGPVTYRDIFAVMPFDNQLISFECDGRFLKQIIETRIEGSRAGMICSGAKVRFSRTRENFDRITELIIGGEEWDPDKIYTVATTDFLMEGNAGLTLLTKVQEENISRNELNLRDAIANHFKQNSPIKTKIDDRWIRDDNSTPKDYLRK